MVKEKEIKVTNDENKFIKLEHDFCRTTTDISIDISKLKKRNVKEKDIIKFTNIVHRKRTFLRTAHDMLTIIILNTLFLLFLTSLTI